MKEQEIRDTFRFHSSNPESVKVHEKVRREITETTVEIAEMLPESRERSLFITYMQQAQMMANAAVAIHAPESGKWHGTDETVLIEYVRNISDDENIHLENHAYVRKNRDCPPILMLTGEQKDSGYETRMTLLNSRRIELDNGAEVSNIDLQKIAGDHILDFERWISFCEEDEVGNSTLVKELKINS